MHERPERIIAQLDYDALGPLGDYLLWCRDRGMRPRTLLLKLYNLRRINARLHPATLLTATDTDIRRWWRALSSRGLSDQTRGIYLSHLRAFYRWAMLEEQRQDDPTRRVMSPLRRRGQPRDLDPAVVAKLLDTLEDRAWMAVALMALCGLRAGEAAKVRPEDMQGDGRGGHTLRVVGKGGHVRSVPVPVILSRAIRSKPPDRPLFRGPQGGPWSAAYMSAFVNSTLRSNGVNATGHQLRHTYATLLYRATHDILGVQRALGHTSAATVQVYVRADTSDLAAVVEKLYTFGTEQPSPPPAPRRGLRLVR